MVADKLQKLLVRVNVHGRCANQLDIVIMFVKTIGMWRRGWRDDNSLEECIVIELQRFVSPEAPVIGKIEQAFKAHGLEEHIVSHIYVTCVGGIVVETDGAPSGVWSLCSRPRAISNVGT